jgi:iron complex transport system ATP-binding protein
MPEPLVSLREVTVVRGGRPVLSDIDLQIDAGECVAILGPNGCGKSTLVKVIAGDLRARSGRGQVRIQGLDRWNLFELRSALGIVTNDLQCVIDGRATGLEVVLSGFFGSYGFVDPDRLTPEMRKAALDALNRAEGSHLALRLFGELSSGESRRVLVARALAHNPQALLLDEPTTSLDIRATHEFLQTVSRLAQTGIGVILVTHHLEDIGPEIGRVVLLKEGRIFADGPKADVLTSENISNLFGAPVSVSGTHSVRGEIAQV